MIKLGGIKMESRKNFKWIIIVLVIIGIVASIMAPSVKKNMNFKNEVKARVSEVTSKYDCVESFSLEGKYSNIVILKVNDKFRDTDYKQKFALIKDIFDIIYNEVPDKVIQYRLNNYQPISDEMKKTKVEALYNGRRYFIDTGSFRELKVEIESDVSATAKNYFSKPDNEIVKEIIGQMEHEYIIDVNMPDDDPLMLNIAFNQDFYSLSASKQYLIIRELFLKYDKVISENGKSNSKYILSAFRPDKKMIVYTMTNKYYKCSGGYWFDDINNIPVFDLDDNPEQIDDMLNNEILEGGEASINIWNYSSNKDESLKSYQDDFPIYSDSDDKYYAATAAQNEVKKRLKSPSSAKFPSISKYNITQSSDGVFTVTGYVDAENSLGATIRTNFTVKIRRVSENSYDVLGIEIYE